MENYRTPLLHTHLTSARFAKGMTQEDLAEVLGVTPQMVSQLESADSDTRLSVLSRWAGALGLEVTLAPARGRPVVVAEDGTVLGAPGGPLSLRDLTRHVSVTGPDRFELIEALLEVHAGLPRHHVGRSGWPGAGVGPLDGLDPDEVVDAILGLQKFEDEYWQAISRQLLGQLVALFNRAHEVDPARFPAMNVRDLGRVLTLGESMGRAEPVRGMLAAVLAGTPDLGQEEFDAVLTPSPDHAAAASGLAARLLDEARAVRPAPYLPEAGQGRPGTVVVDLDDLGPDGREQVIDLLSRGRGRGQVVILSSEDAPDAELLQNVSLRLEASGREVRFTPEGSLLGRLERLDGLAPGLRG